MLVFVFYFVGLAKMLFTKPDLHGGVTLGGRFPLHTTKGGFCVMAPFFYDCRKTPFKGVFTYAGYDRYFFGCARNGGELTDQFFIHLFPWSRHMIWRLWTILGLASLELSERARRDSGLSRICLFQQTSLTCVSPVAVLPHLIIRLQLST